MKADQFLFWLRGYFASASVDTFTKADAKAIQAELERTIAEMTPTKYIVTPGPVQNMPSKEIDDAVKRKLAEPRWPESPLHPPYTVTCDASKPTQTRQFTPVDLSGADLPGAGPLK